MALEQDADRGADNIKRAVLAILVTVFALSLGDAIIKRVSADFPLSQIFVMRSVVAIPVLIMVAKARSRSLVLRPCRVGWTALRSLMLATMWVAYYAALPYLALSVAAAAYYTLPLFITLFAALFVGDRVGVKGWTAVILGFCGVLLILRPQAGAFNAYALLPLVAAVLYALSMIITRTKCRDESPLVLSLGLNLAFIGLGAVASLFIALWGPSSAAVDLYPFLLGHWVAMGPHVALAIGVLAAAVIIGSVGAAIAYQSGPSSTVATFDFAYLAFASLWGLLFFAEIPGPITVAGMVLIVVAGLLAVRRKPASSAKPPQLNSNPS